MTLEYKREPLKEDEVQAMRRAYKTFDEELCVNVLLTLLNESTTRAKQNQRKTLLGRDV